MQSNYNERSWAIDLISEIEYYARTHRRTIRKAGGERTVKASKKSGALFPDVLLFQDEKSLNILQGWELKMPDTPITDQELIENATKKARLLGLNSFLVWNVSEAALYVEKNGSYRVSHSWTDLKDVTERNEVEANEKRWKAMLHTILENLEDYFINGEIRSQNIVTSFSDTQIIEIILSNAGLVKDSLKNHARRNAVFAAAVNEWWATLKIEYAPEKDEYAAVAKLVLLTWINRFLFTHYLKKFTNKAREVDDFNETTTVEKAKVFFNELTQQNDFLNVYAPVIGEDYVDEQSWSQILQLSFFLSELNLENIDQVLLHQLFEKLMLTSKRKAAGQYSTPYTLADYLVRITVNDKSENIMDTCCGTGTILRASYDVKTEFGLSPQEAISTIWGSDKFSFPLQMTTLSLAKPEIIDNVINIFRADVKDLEVGEQFHFVNPKTGKVVNKALPELQSILSNLPFVEASKIKNTNPEIFEVAEIIRENTNIKDFAVSSKSDLVAYLPFYLWFLLGDNGRLGIIVSNSWAGTEWGNAFQKNLSKFYKIIRVVTSGKGKWFQNADVVTNIVVLEKRNTPVEEPNQTESIDFVSLQVPVEQLADKEIVRAVSNATLLQRKNNIGLQSYTRQEIATWESCGIGWSAYFTNLKWLNRAKDVLIKADTFFEINRGERRGWDEMFFPEGNHGIESQYLQPVLKNFRNIDRLVAGADGIAFCCSKSIEELEQEGSTGALNWIRKFENATNETGEPLTKTLKRPNHFWYEMKATTVADLVGTINYGETLFIAKMKKRSFVNQRLIRFTANDPHVDVELCHVLLNSYIGLFYIEALGFGRGLGALDLSSTKVQKNLFMLNPKLLNDSQRTEILHAFVSLLNRDIEKVPVELELDDRKRFEEVIARAYGLENEWDSIKNSLLELFGIRMTIKN